MDRISQRAARARRRPWRAFKSLRLLAPIAAIVAYLVFAIAQPNSAPVAGAGSIRLPIGYTGVDYYWPTEYFTHCQDLEWLQSSCYDNASMPDSARQQLLSDLNFVQTNKIASTMRVWISLDQLMNWNPSTGFAGFTPGALSNVDDMLSIFHQYGIRVVLVLYTYSSGNVADQFQPRALDGRHAAMRAGYVTALRQFMVHLEANATDVATAPFIEIQNEPYYQLETYFADPSNLGAFRSTCAPEGKTDWGCVDRRIIHPWLVDLYHAARQAAPTGFYYSFSDTGRLFEDYNYWSKMYPGDIINEHVYDSTPWLHASLYKRGRQFRKPWIVTEAGCDSGDVACTYVGQPAGPGQQSAIAPDEWWLQHLGRDGAQSVMLESHVTLWTYPDGPASATPTEAGREAISAMHDGLGPTLAGGLPPKSQPPVSTPTWPPASPVVATMFNNFDHMPSGPLQMGAAQFLVAGVVDSSRLTVQDQVFKSAPNALAVNVTGGGSAFVSRYPAWSGSGFRVHFDLQLAPNLAVTQGGYLDLAQLRLGNAASPALRLSLVMGSGRRLDLCSGSGWSTPKCWVGAVQVQPGRWYRVTLRTTGSALTFSINGSTQVTIQSPAILDQPVRYAGIGLYSGTVSPLTRGTFYLDDILLSQ